MNDGDFNLPAPHGFRGLDPQRRVRIYQRHLPHWRQEGATYFVTFRLADSIPQAQLRALKRWREKWEREHPEPRSHETWKQLAREITNRTEAWVDEGYGACELGRREIAGLMADSLLKFQHDRHHLSCYVVMPNHVHAVIKPLGEHKLEDLLGGMKSYVAHRTKKMLARSGALWAEESYDRIIRDEEHLYRVVQYIGRNAAKAGLPQSSWHRWIDPEWERLGWRFTT